MQLLFPEWPQTGRQLQFHQIDLEFLGFADARSDEKAITTALDLLADEDVLGLALELNTIGSAEDRARHRERLVAFLMQHIIQLDPGCQERNQPRILDPKNTATQELLADAPTRADALALESLKPYKQL